MFVIFTQPLMTGHTVSSFGEYIVQNPLVVDDTRIAQMKPLITPAILLEELPMSDAMVASVAKDRAEIQDICMAVIHAWWWSSVHVRFMILTPPKNTLRD